MRACAGFLATDATDFLPADAAALFTGGAAVTAAAGDEGRSDRMNGLPFGVCDFGGARDVPWSVRRSPGWPGTCDIARPSGRCVDVREEW